MSFYLFREPKTFKISKSDSYTDEDAELHGIKFHYYDNIGDLQNQTFSNIKSQTIKDALKEIRDIFIDKKYEDPKVFFHETKY